MNKTCIRSEVGDNENDQRSKWDKRMKSWRMNKNLQPIKDQNRIKNKKWKKNLRSIKDQNGMKTNKKWRKNKNQQPIKDINGIKKLTKNEKWMKTCSRCEVGDKEENEWKNDNDKVQNGIKIWKM